VSASPTVRRRQLGAELRRLREGAGLGIEDAAARLECSLSKISRMETGRVPVRSRDVRDLLDLYGVTDDAACEPLLTLARESRQRGWWQPYSDVVPSWLEVYLGLEAAAASISIFETGLVPGLLQTADYTRAVVRAMRPDVRDQEIERRVSLRMTRQQLVVKDEPVMLWVVLDEAVLRRPVGGPAVLRGQLLRILERAEFPHVTVQVLPFSAGAHAGLGASFTLLAFPEPADPEVVYVEELTSSFYVERLEEVRWHRIVLDHLRAAALSPDRSAEMIDEVVKELS
jgi:transcriptional regulator with XRE-family HTH domain